MEMKYSRLHPQPNSTNKRINRRVVLFLLITALLVCALYYTVFNSKSARYFFRKDKSYSLWTPYRSEPLKAQEWVKQHCFHSVLSTELGALETNLNRWKKADDPYCVEQYEAFDQMYKVSFRIGSVKLPPEFAPLVSGWLKNDKTLMEELNHQDVVHIFNLYTREYMAFSPLRSKRPQSKPDVDPRKYVDEIVRKTEKDCDFCNYKIHTAEDSFGRIETNNSVSAANTFKVDRWHSLILPHKHNPLELNEVDVVDMFQAATVWMKKVVSLEPEYKYPWILWDSMPHAGASQVHPHLHVGMALNMYVGLAESTRRGAEEYYRKFGRNYFSDLTEIHSALGLTANLGEAVAIAQLTSKKDTEVTIISAQPNTDFFRMIYYTIKAFLNMGFYDISSLCVFPIMGPDDDGSMPALMRITTRGDVATVKSEISSFELFQFSNINVDPYTVIDNVQKSIMTARRDSPYEKH